MKIKTIYSAIIVITICLLAFIGCDSTINEDTDYAAFNGEYRFIGCRTDYKNELQPKGDGFDLFYIFNGTNRLKTKYIAYETEYVFEYECEFELNNGKIRERGYNARFETFNDWEDWLNYNFNDDVLEINFFPDFYFVDFYRVFKKI
jgi:hypothetical protein